MQIYIYIFAYIYINIYLIYIYYMCIFAIIIYIYICIYICIVYIYIYAYIYIYIFAYIYFIFAYRYIYIYAYISYIFIYRHQELSPIYPHVSGSSLDFHGMTMRQACQAEIFEELSLLVQSAPQRATAWVNVSWAISFWANSAVASEIAGKSL